MTSPETTDPCGEPRLRAWLEGQGLEPEALTPMAGDVSARRYFRVQLGRDETAVLACYPPQLAEDCRRFERSTELLAMAGVRVPELLAVDCEHGLTLLEDIGRETLYESAPNGPAERTAYFEHAAELCTRIGSIPPTAAGALNPPLDAELLQSELRRSWESFLEPRGLTGGGASEGRLAEALDGLCTRLADGPYTPCHRDFMVRNLLPFGPVPGMAVIDHQGLRLGPRFYDLASLFNDSLFLGPHEEHRILSRYLDGDADWEAFHRAAAQRCLKAVGTYATFAAGGNDRHLHLAAPTLHRAAEHLAKLPEAAAVSPELGSWRDLLD